MKWRRPASSLRLRMTLALSVLLVLAVAPLLVQTLWQYPRFAWAVGIFAAVLLTVQYRLVSRFTSFIEPLSAWAHEWGRGVFRPRALLPENDSLFSELNRLLADGVRNAHHRDQALAEARELLEHSERRLQTWAAKIQDVMFELDADGNIVSLNAAWQALTGFAVEDSLGEPLAAYLDEDDIAGLWSPQNLAALQLTNYETRLRTADGTPRWIRITASAERAADGALLGVSGVLSDITKTVELGQLVSRYEDELYQLSVIDPLTGLYNRRHFDAQLDAILADHLPRGRPVCLLLVDLDGFKFINDTYGHPFGDEVLRRVTQLLREQVRRNDYLARTAGDEFAMVLKNTCLRDAERIAHKLHAHINAAGIDLPIGRTYMHASIGVVEAPTHAADAQGLVSAADVALYHGRRRGRNRVETLSPDMSRAMISIFSQGFQLRRALEAGDVHPAFQPIHDLHLNRPVAYEVLARMHVNGEIIQAKDFIGVAQELGLTAEMDLHVIRQALTRAPEEYELFLNVDLQSLGERGFLDNLEGVLKPARARGRRITIEITERETLIPHETLAADIERLRALGCRLALDDFGSGYSTYKFLNLFRPDYIKIEGSFVREMLQHESSRKIVTHIHELAGAFGIGTIAESVEDGLTEAALRAIGIRNAQGLHFGAPALLK